MTHSGDTTGFCQTNFESVAAAACSRTTNEAISGAPRRRPPSKSARACVTVSLERRPDAAHTAGAVADQAAGRFAAPPSPAHTCQPRASSLSAAAAAFSPARGRRSLLFADLFPRSEVLFLCLCCHFIWRTFVTEYYTSHISLSGKQYCVSHMAVQELTWVPSASRAASKQRWKSTLRKQRLNTSRRNLFREQFH